MTLLIAQNNLTELKSFGTPPAAVARVAEAVLVLFSPKGKVPKDRSWKACRVTMGSIDGFLVQLRNYDKENIHPDVVRAIQPYITDKGIHCISTVKILDDITDGSQSSIRSWCIRNRKRRRDSAAG